MIRALLITCMLLPALAQDAQLTRDLADGLYSRGMFELSMGEYEKLLKAAPDYAEKDVVYYRLAEASMALKNPQGAEAWYAKLTAEFPKSEYASRALLRRGELQLQGKQYDQALVQFAGVLSRKPGGDLQAGAEFFSGIAHAALKRDGLAVKHFKTVTTAHRDSGYVSLASLEYARILEKQDGKEAELEQLYGLAISKPASDDIETEARFQLANLQFRKKSYPESADSFSTLFQRFPDAARSAEGKLTAAWANFNGGAPQATFDLLSSMPQADVLRAAAEWTYLKANCLRSLKNYEAAIPTYERLIQTAPDSPFTRNARYELLLILYDQKRFADVLTQTSELSGDTELKEDVLWLQAQASQSLNDPLKAAATYEEIATAFPKAVRASDALYSSAQMFQEAGEFKRAAGLYERFGSTFAAHALSPRAWFASGLCSLNAKDGAAAGKAWSELAKRFPDDELVDDGLFQKAVAEIRMQQKPAAVTTLRDLLKRRPDTSFALDARYYLAAILDELDKVGEAEAAYLELIAAKPPSPMLEQAQHRLGLTYYRQSKFDDAANIMVPVLGTAEADSMSPDLLIWLAQHLQTLKSYEAAIVAAKRVNAPPMSPRNQQLAWWVMGGSQDALNQKEEAIKSFSQTLAIKINTRESIDAAMRLGVLQQEAGRFAEAKEAYTIAGSGASKLGQLNDQARSYFGLGSVSKAEKNWGDASRYFMAMAVLFDDPDLTPEALYEAGAAFGQLGNVADQNKAWSELRSRYPDNPFTKKLP